MLASPYLNLLQKSMDAVWLRQQVLSNNIANHDTPGFKSQEVKFEELLQTSLSRNGLADGKLPEAKVITHTNTALREDGNNVDIDKEYTELYRTYMQYEYLARQVSSRFSTLRAVITDGRG